MKWKCQCVTLTSRGRCCSSDTPLSFLSNTAAWFLSELLCTMFLLPVCEFTFFYFHFLFSPFLLSVCFYCIIIIYFLFLTLSYCVVFFFFSPLVFCPLKWARVHVVGGLFGNTRRDRLPACRLSRWWLEAIRYQLSPPRFKHTTFDTFGNETAAKMQSWWFGLIALDYKSDFESREKQGFFAVDPRQFLHW